jgi:hypothetical protein
MVAAICHYLNCQPGDILEFRIDGSVIMTAVAQGLVATCLAATEKHLFRFISLILYRRELRVCMGAVAERLAGALTAGAPKVRLACLNVNAEGSLGGTYWIIHMLSPC